MGYTIRKHRAGETRHFWPDDTDTEFFIADSAVLGEIMLKVMEKWPGCRISDILIEAEFLHTDCLGYDMMDWGDYTRFLRITNTKG